MTPVRRRVRGLSIYDTQQQKSRFRPPYPCPYETYSPKRPFGRPHAIDMNYTSLS